MTVTVENPQIAPEPRSPRPITVTVRRNRSDRVFRTIAWTAGVVTFVVLVLIGFFLYWNARPAFRVMGVWGFLTTQSFVTTGRHPSFGVAAPLLGTLTISAIALVLAVPVAMCAALFINEYAPRTLLGFIPVKGFLIAMVDLMAAVPSVIYGLWGLFVLEPNMTGLSRFLSDHLGFIPGFSSTVKNYTASAFIAGTLVAIMVMPIITALSREVFSLTPIGEREGALSLGASRSRVIRDVVWPFARGGVIGAVLLGLGRALGEAIAVTFIISLVYRLQGHVLQEGSNSIAALIAARFGSGGALGLAALLAAGLVLFFLTLLLNLVASSIVNRSKVARN